MTVPGSSLTPYGRVTYIRNKQDDALAEATGWLLAPCFQYVFRSSGGIPNPNDPTGLSRIGDAAVLGVTTTLRY